MSDDPKNGDETRGIAIVGMAFGLGILSVLTRKGIVTSDQTDEFLDGLLSSLEDFLDPNDPGVHSARVFVDAIGQAIADSRKRGPINP